MSWSRPSSISFSTDAYNNKGMFSEDEDSRDSGLGDEMRDGPSFQKGTYYGEQLFILDEEMEDLVIDENRNTKIESKAIRKNGRPFDDISNQSPVSRNIHRTKSTMLLRKRTLPNLDHHPKRQKELENHENDQPADHGPPACRRRSLLRAFSTSTLEVHRSPSAEDDLPHQPVVNYSLPVLGSCDSVAFRRIDASTLSNLMATLPTDSFLARYVLIDCRYPYEYDGGHIQHAVNLYDPSQCEQFFFGNVSNDKRIPIFYCEYSQKRGPGMATALRGADRVRNVDRYPHVSFEEIYVLDKGYKGFYEMLSRAEAQSLCSPCNYVKMDDPQYTQVLRTFAFHHRRYTTSATCVKPETKSRILLRQTSHDSPVGRRQCVRRPLFPIASPPETKLDPQRLTYSPDSPML